MLNEREIMDTSVMKHDEDTSFEEKLQQEYDKAVEEGFEGTKEEYLSIRDYT